MKIAVIGSGISGLVAAYLLSEDHEITVFEANDYIGGHTHTIDVETRDGTVAVDTGFIVFNEKTYPNFTTLMKQLGVAWQFSDMSFSVQCAGTGLTFSPSSLNALFAQRKNIFRPSFYRMLLDALRFRRESQELIHQDDDSIKLAVYLQEKGYSRGFIDHFIIPMGAAIWSTDPKRFLEFPARYLVEFFQNHGFLNIRHQPQWLTITGGSKQYIEPLTRRFKRGIRLNDPVKRVHRAADHVRITLLNGETETFDQAVIAAHSDQALAMLADPSEAETQILGAIAYQENLTVLHTDERLLPRPRRTWASWNYYIPGNEMDRVALTYYMNYLQGLKTRKHFCVTLNLPDAVDPEYEVRRMIYHHPVYTPQSLAARRRRDEINGVNRTWFCGAYWGYGFHEDGVNSALAVCKHFGKSLTG